MDEKKIEFLFPTLQEWDELREGFPPDESKVCLCVHKHPRLYSYKGIHMYPGPEEKIWLIRSINSEATYTKSILNFLETVDDMVNLLNLDIIYLIDCPADVRAEIEDKNLTAQDACLAIKKGFDLK